MSFPAAFNPERLFAAGLGRFRQRVCSRSHWTERWRRLAPDSNGRGGRQAATRRRERGPGRNVLIVGAGPMGRKLAAILEREHIDGRAVVGFLDERELVAGDVLGRVEESCPHRAPRIRGRNHPGDSRPARPGAPGDPRSAPQPAQHPGGP